MESNRIHQDTGRVVALALGFFGLLALLAWSEGVFDRLDAGEVLALAVFAAVMAGVTWAVDADVRAYVRRLPALRKSAATSPAAKRAAT